MELAEWLSVVEIGQKIVIIGLNSRYKIEVDDNYGRKGIDVDNFLNDDKFAFLYNKKINYVYAENDIIKIGLVH